MSVSKVGKYVISMIFLSGPWLFFVCIFCLFVYFGGGVFHPGWLSVLSINLLVVYRESVNLIGYITRRLSADSLQL